MSDHNQLKGIFSFAKFIFESQLYATFSTLAMIVIWRETYGTVLFNSFGAVSITTMAVIAWEKCHRNYFELRTRCVTVCLTMYILCICLMTLGFVVVLQHNLLHMGTHFPFYTKLIDFTMLIVVVICTFGFSVELYDGRFVDRPESLPAYVELEQIKVS